MGDFERTMAQSWTEWAASKLDVAAVNMETAAVKANTQLEKLRVAAEPSIRQIGSQLQQLGEQQQHQADRPSPRLFGQALSKLEQGSDYVPVVLEAILRFIEAEACDMDDIFSRSPDLTDVQQLQAQFEAAGTAVFPNGCSPRVVAGLLLLFLHNLPESVVQHELYDCFVAVHDMPEGEPKQKNLRHLCNNLQPVNRAVFVRICKMLRKMADHGRNEQLMAVIFGPLLIRAPPRSNTIRYFALPAIVSATTVMIQDFHPIVSKLGLLPPQVANAAHRPDLSLVLQSPEGVIVLARPSTFGPSVSQVPTVQAQLVLASPPDGNTALQNAPDISGKIALMVRGNCSFSHKVLSAQAAGAIAAVVMNTTDQELAYMTADATAPATTIPSVMISRLDGVMLQRELPKVMGTLSAAPPPAGLSAGG